MSNEIFDFDKILTYLPTEELIVSTYLLVDGGRVTKKDYLSELNSMIAKTKENIEVASGFDKSKQRMIFNALDKIKSFVGDLFKNENEKTLLIYAGTKSELWEVYKLPIILKSKIIVDPKPHTQSLRSILHNYKKYGVLLIDRGKAQIYQVYLGEIKEYLAAYISDVPPKVNFRFESGLREKKILGNIEEKLRHFYKMLNDSAFGFFRDSKFDYLILAGRKEVINEFTSYLHSYLSAMLAGTFEGEITENQAVILEKAKKVIKDFEDNNTNQHISRLIDELEPQGLGVLGLKKTIDALMSDNIKTLVYLEDYTARGYSCPACGFLTLKLAEKCPYCENQLLNFNDIVDEIVESALNQGSEIMQVKENEKLKNSGKIGAVLRYKHKV
ncbi:MAG: baeRF10 domain-containing protein [Candidatus Humimicrobiaceae bacterium]